MGSSQPWIDTAYELIVKAHRAEQPVWIKGTVQMILRDHPDCPLTEVELSGIVRRLVIEEHGSFDSS